MSKRRGIRAAEVIGRIPDKLLDDLTLETGVDYSVKKLSGKAIFKLYLFALLNGRKISQRILEAIFASKKFRQLFDIEADSVRYSAISMRLKNVNYHYFEEIFQYLVSVNKTSDVILGSKKIAVRKIDSTLVSLSAKLLQVGIESPTGWRAVKYGVELSGGIPVNIRLFTRQQAANDGHVFPELLEHKPDSRGLSIAIFDRGVQEGAFLLGLERKNIYFISRLSRQYYEVKRELPVEAVESPTLRVISDQIIIFSKFKRGEQTLRLVRGVSKDSGEEYFFLTNVTFLSALEIGELYKSRWEIETFFRFIKQELNFRHLLSRSENGIKAVMYLTMIAAILLTLYKRQNNIVGWEVAKIRFLDELESDIMQEWHKEMTAAFELPKSKAYVNSS